MYICEIRSYQLKNIPDLVSDEKEGKIMLNIDFSYFINLASFMGNPVRFISEASFICPSVRQPLRNN